MPFAPSHPRPDAIIIGAGLAGLTAAAFLARAGARVLVCEQAAQVGGLFNSFWRDGYLFDGGIKAVENSAVMLPMLAQLGLRDRVQLRRSPIALVAGGVVRPMLGFADVEAYFHYLASLFPADAAGLRRILRDTRAIFDLLDRALSFPIPFFQPAGAGSEAQKAWLKQNAAILRRLPRAALFMRTELRPYLRRRLKHTGLINLLSQLFPDGTSVFFGLGYYRMFLDYHYPHGGIGAIPAALADVVAAGGGEIRLNTRVERVLLSGGEACGVRLASGEEILAGHVIAASDLRQTLTRLVPADAVPAGFARKLACADVSHSVFNLFLGVDLPAERFNIRDCQHFFYIPDQDGIDEVDRVSRPDYFAHVPQEISIPCLHQPELAPAGKSGLIVSAMASWHFAGGWDRDPAGYVALKERCAGEIIASLERFIPNLSARIELCFTATPRTMARVTSNSHGSIMGWSYDRRRTLPRGNILQMRSAVLTPVPRLLAAGQWAFSPGGSPVAVLTGKLAAEHVLKHL